jgi:hypothetical protein
MCPTTRPAGASMSAAAPPTPRRDAAIDTPPPVRRVGGGGGDTVPVRSITPQHLLTCVTPATAAASLAPPLLLNEQYLVWGLAHGQVALWSLAVGRPGTAPPLASPTVVYDTGATSPWMQVSATNATTLLALTAAGVLYQLHVTDGSVRLDDSATWASGRPGTTCFAVLQQQSPGHDRQDVIVLGYENGHLEGWCD